MHSGLSSNYRFEHEDFTKQPLTEISESDVSFKSLEKGSFTSYISETVEISNDADSIEEIWVEENKNIAECKSVSLDSKVLPLPSPFVGFLSF